MSYLFDNLIQVGVAGLLLISMTLPTGWLLLRWLTPELPRWLLFPVAILIGLLVVPFLFNFVGMVITLNMLARLVVWILWHGLLLAITSRRPLTFQPEKLPLLLVVIALLAILITLFPLLFHNVPIGDRWYYIMAGDWIKHIGVGNGLATDDRLPPTDPFLSTEAKLRYYYFAYILPGMASRLTNGAITVTNSLVAEAVLIAGALPFLLYGYARRVGLSISAAVFAVSMIILISGWDIAYVLDEQQRTGQWVEHIDFWANHDLRRINSISNMFIWTPQHVLGAAGFILIAWLIQELWAAPRQFLPLITVMTLLLAALSGTSAFAWFGILCALGMFVAVEILALTLDPPPSWRGTFNLLQSEGEGDRRVRAMLVIILAVLLSLLISYPYLHIVGERQERAFTLDISPTVSGIKYGGVFSELLGANTLAYLLDFPLQMTIEFGAVMLTGLYGLWLVRQQWRTRPEIRLWGVSLLTFFVIVLAIRPDRADSNNYAARVAPLAWIILGLLSGYWWQQRRQWQWPLLAVPLLLGLGSTLYEPWIQQGPNYQRLLGYKTSIERQNYVTRAQHELYTWLNEHTGRDDTYQIGWESGKATYFVERRTGVTEGYLALLYVSHDTLFYIDELAALELGFNAPDPAEAAAALQHIHIDYIVTDEKTRLAAQADPAFGESFILVFENEVYKVYQIHD